MPIEIEIEADTDVTVVADVADADVADATSMNGDEMLDYSQPGEEEAVDLINGDGSQGEESISQEEDAYAVTSNPSEMAELRAKAEQQHEASLLDAKEELSQLAIRRSELEAELKNIKAEEKGALKHLQILINRGPIYPKEQSKLQEAVANSDGSASEKLSKYDPQPQQDSQEEGNESDASPLDESWKLKPTAEVIDGIRGLGKKKLEAITDLAPTLGDLVELQALAGLEHKPFHKVLPDGVGQSMADEIEERIAQQSWK